MEINKYSNGKIYQVIDIGYNKTYIGSTIETLSRRMGRHRSNFKSFNNGDVRKYTTAYKLFNEYGIDNCKIELLELFPDFQLH